MSKSEEFFNQEDPLNNKDYDSEMDDWYFSKEDMLIFAKRYAKAKLEEAAEKAKKTLLSNNHKHEGIRIMETVKSITETPLD